MIDIEVSVLIVMRNEENYIIECINSIENQFDKDDKWELVLVDGISEDKSKEFDKKFIMKQWERLFEDLIRRNK